MPSPNNTWRTLAAVAVAALLGIGAGPHRAQAQDKHVTVIPQANWGTLPEWIPMDVHLEDCEAKGGTQTGRQGQKICSIKTSECQTHAGFKVVERDAYKQSSARIAACRFE